MEIIAYVIDLFVHLDEHLSFVLARYGSWTYLILFLVIFMETGFVVTPFLPGDSLLFAAGTFAALGDLEVRLLFVLLFAAAVAGDTVNYWIGRKIGPKVFDMNVRWLKREYLERTHRFYERHGGKTIFLARFVPIIRTFAPFVAGVGAMSYGRFLAYNLFGGLVWTGGFIFLGYYFGNLPIVRENFGVVVIAIIFISVLPMIAEFISSRLRQRRARHEAATAYPGDPSSS
ncbi:MAG TPA: DedA family protein [Anaerolineales bacterium]|nr:DedA family protein [Anaerolineales bacterium]